MLLPTQTTINKQTKRDVRINRKIYYAHVTLQDLIEWAKEGFAKASNDGPLIGSYGNS
jgi:hypothetical protein